MKKLVLLSLFFAFSNIAMADLITYISCGDLSRKQGPSDKWGYDRVVDGTATNVIPYKFDYAEPFTCIWDGSLWQ